jgi:hypothetical protein
MIGLVLDLLPKPSKRLKAALEEAHCMLGANAYLHSE